MATIAEQRSDREHQVLKRRLKVMHAVFSLDIGGLENGVVNLCNGLDGERFDVSVCVFRSGGSLETRLDSKHVDLVAVTSFRNNDASLPFRLAWQLRRRGVDILHTHSWGTLIEGVMAAKLARTSVLIHGEHGTMETRFHHRQIQRFLWSRTDQVTAVAGPLADRMANVVRFPREKIKVIPNGVDSFRFRPEREAIELRRKELGLPTTGLLIGTVARLVPVKNHRGMLHALAVLREKGLTPMLALAGDGPLESELRNLTRELSLEGQVRFLGAIRQVERFLNALDVFVLNSLSEGMSNTVLEAMSCGLPVVATNVGGNSDLVEDDRTGYLIPQDNVEELARAIARIANDQRKREKMGIMARARIEQSFGIGKMVQNYSDMYESLYAHTCHCSSRRDKLACSYTLDAK